MISTAVHHTWKQRWFSFILMVAASLLPMIATLTSTPVHAAVPNTQTLSSSITINTIAKIPPSMQVSNGLQLAFVVFFTRPLACTQDSHNCQGDITVYAPDKKVTCSSPMSNTASSSWVTKGEQCPYLTCNYLSVTSCSAQSAKTVFRTLPQPIPNVGDSFMIQFMKFGANDLGSADTVQLSGCIYYGNWPQFPAQNTQLAFSWPKLTLLAGKLPRGVNMQKILGQSNSAFKQSQAGTGWGP
jgi:hypothetical protein